MLLEEALTQYEEVVEQAVDNGINIVSQDYSINWDYSQAGGHIFHNNIGISLNDWGGKTYL